MTYRVGRNETGKWEDLHAANDYQDALDAFGKALNNEAFGSTATVAIWVFPKRRGRRPFVIEINR
jgi:hypothetical protein